MKNLKHSVGLFLVALIPHFASASVFGPYAPDANTAFLFHLDEPASVYVTTNAIGSLSAGTNAVAYATVTGNTFPGVGVSAPTNFNILGGIAASGFTGFGGGSFGKAANLANAAGGTNGLGVDMDLNGGFALNNNGSVGNDTVSSHSSIMGVNNSFTLEALINIAATNSNQEIICTDNGGANNVRGFQFRLTGPQMEFFDIGQGAGAVAANDVKVNIPAAGPNAFVAGQWFHVAVTHTETPVAGGTNTIFYWTALSDSAVVANAVATNTAALVDPTDPMLLDIGNEGRSAGSSLGSGEGLQGLIDEVRISKINRSAGQMMFYSPVISFTTQPTSSQTMLTNQSTSLTAVAVGSGTVTYQWYFFDATSTNLISGATGTTLNVTAGSAVGVSNYFSVASNAGISTPATSQVAMVTIRIPQNMQWKGVGADWDTVTANWTTNGGATTAIYSELDKVTFDSLGGTQPSVNLTADRSPAAVLVNTTGGDYNLGGAGAIVGTGSLTKNSNGKLTLTTANAFSGGTSLNAGMVELDGAGQIGTGPVLNNGNITANSSGTANFPATISGSGSFTNLSGNASLSASNSYTGATVVSAGTLFAANSSSLGDVSSGTVVNPGGQLFITGAVSIGAEPLTLNGSGPAADGALRKNGGNAASFGGAITLASDTTIKLDGSGTLNLTNAAGINGSAANANLTLLGDGGSAGTISGPVVLGTGGLTVNAAAWTLAGTANHYSGLLTLSAGTLNILSDTALGIVPGSFNASQITLGGTLGALTNVSLIDGNRGITISSAGGFSVASGSTLTVSNALTGAATTLTKSSPGTLVLKGDNSATLSGTLNTDTSSTGSSDGNTRLASPNAISGVAIINIRNNNGGTSTLQLDGSGGAIILAPTVLNLSGRNNLVPAIENLSGNNTLSPSFSFAYVVGGGTYQFSSAAGTLTVGTAVPTGAPAGFRTTMFSGSGDIVVSGVIQDTAVMATLTNSVLKTGSGTLTLQAANTYAGATIISNGLLRVDGSIGAGGVVTNAGGTLGGSGTINTPVFILPGAALAPGDSIGTLTINGDLNLAGNFALEVNKSLSPSQSNDLAVVNGGLTNSGTGAVLVSNLGPALSIGDKFTLFSQAVTNGAAMSVTGAGLIWNNNLAVDGSISVAGIVNPNPTNLTAVVNGGKLELSWPADHTGWRLQAQTNSLSVGLNTSWVDVPNSAAVNSVTNTLNPASGSVFYRMVYP